MFINVNGKFFVGIIVKDIIFVIIGKIGYVGVIGYVIEYVGEVICGLSMEECMMVCNMSIEVGVKVGFVVLDEKIFVYFEGCEYVFKG